MGQKVKIADLKKFDVFRKPHDSFTSVVLGGDHFMRLSGIAIHKFYPEDSDKEVELLGRMEFIENHSEYIQKEYKKLQHEIDLDSWDCE